MTDGGVMAKRLTKEREADLRERASTDVQDLLAEIDALRAELASRDVCEACGDCLVPESPRCERHAHTEPGDPEWTMEQP